MKPVTVEIVALTPTEFFHCPHCELVWRESGMGPKIHAEQRASALPPDLAEEYRAIGCWAEDLVARHADRVDLRVMDVLSPEGFLMVLRHRLGRYPAFVVDGHRVRGGLQEVSAAIEERLDKREAMMGLRFSGGEYEGGVISRGVAAPEASGSHFRFGGPVT